VDSKGVSLWIPRSHVCKQGWDLDHRIRPDEWNDDISMAFHTYDARQEVDLSKEPLLKCHGAHGAKISDSDLAEGLTTS
jgi:hypothetical protein